MAVYSIQMDENQRALQVQVTKRFKVFNLVTLTLRDGQTINGEIVFIGKEEIHVTGPYGPIEIFKFTDICDIASWRAPEDWQYKPRT